ncbi:MAG: hypothetical protein HY282_04915 [Nitrospirae bacterium]|nr:hypothetical protein [Candidatus Manganitrophaceae bacterium]
MKARRKPGLVLKGLRSSPRGGERSAPERPGSIFTSEQKRLTVSIRLLAVFVLLCLGFSWKLWVSTRLYPLVPLFKLIPAFPYPFDYLFLALFSALLLALVIWPRSKILVRLIVAAFTLFFLQDQSRLWPSFYEFFFLFLLLLTDRNDAGEDEARRILDGFRFIIAAIYFWGGVQKLNPHFFNEEFPWFVQPLTHLLPFDIPYLPALGVFAAVFEVLFGIGLLTKRFRVIALYDAILMHVLIFFCIGPIRNDWNDSAWIWGQTMAVLVWVLFYKAPPFSFKKMFDAPPLYNLPQAGALLFIGILPLFNNVNRWDSALSFNVYTGNVDYAQIRMQPEAARKLPAALSRFVTEREGEALLNLNAWTMHEFNANPYPEKRVFKAVLGTICSYVPDNSVYLLLHEKSGWFFPKRSHLYHCGEM